MRYVKSIIIGLIMSFLWSVVPPVFTTPHVPASTAVAQVSIPGDFRPQYAPVLKKKDEKNYSERSIANIIGIVINVLLYAAGTVTIFFLIKGSLQYVTGGEGDNEGAKNTITWSIVGLLVIVLSYLIVENVITYIFRIQETT